MNRLTITRFCNHSVMGVFGELSLDGVVLGYSVEQPWNNNLPFKSCVPAGFYRLEPWSSKKYPYSYVLVNPGLKVYKFEQPDDPLARYACLLHTANWAKDVKGCIGFGRDMGYSQNALMVQHSAATTKKVIRKIGDNDIQFLEIKWGLPCDYATS